MTMHRFIFVFALSVVFTPPALPCSICGGDFQNRPTLRQEISTAKVVVVGTLSNAQLTSDSTGEGQTDLKIGQIIKGSEFLKGVDIITLPRYYPGDGMGPQRGVFFFDVREGKLQIVSGRTARSEHLAGYVSAVTAL